MTTEHGAIGARTFFLPGSAGDLYALSYTPATPPVPRAGVIVVPPFTEEMNKSRRMLARQMRALAAHGLVTILPDLYGTGDSQGGFGAARWDIWKQDIAAAAAWMREQGVAWTGVLALRLGALLAMEWIDDGAAVDRVFLWQPVVSGELAISQFLRTRVAASMLAGPEERESLKALRQALQRGETIEVAGYEIAPELASAISDRRLDACGRSTLPPVEWFEVVADAEATLAPAGRRVIEQWQSRGADVLTVTVPGTAFWSSVEIAEVPALLEATTRRITHSSIAS